MYKLAAFDMDGTLLDTVHDLAMAGNFALRSNDFPERAVDAYKYFAGNGVHNLILRALAPVTDPDSVLRVEAAFRAYYAEHTQDYTRPYDGIPEALENLKRAGVRLAVLSNKPHEYTHELAEQYFPGVFDVALGQREGIPLKPDPAALREIMRRLNIAVEDGVYIGDTAVDVQTGHNAGLPTIGVLWGFRPKEELESAGADVIITKCSDLVKIIIDKTPALRLY